MIHHNYDSTKSSSSSPSDKEKNIISSEKFEHKCRNIYRAKSMNYGDHISSENDNTSLLLPSTNNVRVDDNDKTPTSSNYKIMIKKDDLTSLHSHNEENIGSCNCNEDGLYSPLLRLDSERNDDDDDNDNDKIDDTNPLHRTEGNDAWTTLRSIFKSNKSPINNYHNSQYLLNTARTLGTNLPRNFSWSNLLPVRQESMNLYDDDYDDDNDYGDRFLDEDETFIPPFQHVSTSSLPGHEINTMQRFTNQIQRKISISAIFLKDYEYSRPSSLPSNISTITTSQITLHKIRFSFIWQFLLCSAVATLLTSSFLEGFHNVSSSPYANTTLFIMTAYSSVILISDMLMRRVYDNEFPIMMYGEESIHTRKSRARWWQFPLTILLVAMVLETFIKTLLVSTECTADDMDENQSDCGTRVIWSSIFKPVVFFYASSKARDALSALHTVAPIVSRVIMVELCIILCFAAVACQLYYEFEHFGNLTVSFKSLFELSTTAVNPSIWIHIYNKTKTSSLFFVTFIIICVIYIHSLVLSVVFQSYIQAMKNIRERASADKEKALEFAFVSLQDSSSINEHSSSYVHVDRIRGVLEILRPHYNKLKIDTLVRLVNPSNHEFIDFDAFRNVIPKVLRTSLRSTRHSTSASKSLESFAFLIAMTNLVFVLMLCSRYDVLWWDVLVFPSGIILTIMCISELSLRYFRYYHLHLRAIKFHFLLDGIAILASTLSAYGLYLRIFGYESGINWLLLGRAIDMIRIMRFSSIFQGIIKRSGEVIPSLVGPLALVLTAVHLFTYVGMYLWGGAITIGSYDGKIPALYDLNNFNDYQSGILTMFNILIVNDWFLVASVFLNADKNSSEYIVYPFFISANLIAVNILLNVLTAFFVGAFVSIVETRGKTRNQAEISINPSTFGSTSSLRRNPNFRVLKRQRFDDVMKSVAGEDNGQSFASKVFHALEFYETIRGNTTENCGYLIYCYQSNTFLESRSFKTISTEILDESKMTGILSDIIEDLLKSINNNEESELDYLTTLSSSSPPSRTTQNSNMRTYYPLEYGNMNVSSLSQEKMVVTSSLIQFSPPVALISVNIRA